MSNKHFRRTVNEESLYLKHTTDDNLIKETENKITERLNKFNFLQETEENDVKETTSESEEEENKIIKNLQSNKNLKNKKKTKKKKKILTEIKEDLVLSGEKELIENYNDKETLRKNLIKINSRDLNPDEELRKLLGKTLRKTMETEKRVATNARNLRKYRSKLVKVNLEWPLVKQIGISMNFVSEKNNIKWFRFVFNEAYSNLEELFEVYQRHMDYEAIINDVMSQCPYHLKSLILYAEHMRITENKESARDAIERGLYACESIFHLNFQPLSFESRLSYIIPENRQFYLLLYYYMIENINRNCFVTALEFAKIIFFKDPDSDPLGILLIIDSLALKAKKYQFLIDFYTVFKDEKQLDMLPNFLFSLSLAYFMISINLTNKKLDEQILTTEEPQNNAKNFLNIALIRFPFILGQILDKLQIKADSVVENNYSLNTLAYYKENEGLQLISDIYLHHSQDVWKIPNVLSWLEITTHEVLKNFSLPEIVQDIKDWKKLRKRCFIGIPRNVMRHAIIHSIRQSESNNNFSLVDPCPPQTKVLNTTSKSVRNENETYQESLSNLMTEFFKSLMPHNVQMQLKSLSGSAKSYVDKTLKWFQNNSNYLFNHQLSTSNEQSNLN